MHLIVYSSLLPQCSVVLFSILNHIVLHWQPHHKWHCILCRQSHPKRHCMSYFCISAMAPYVLLMLTDSVLMSFRIFSLCILLQGYFNALYLINKLLCDIYCCYASLLVPHAIVHFTPVYRNKVVKGDQRSLGESVMV